jgi:hypothetical protein
MRNFFRVAILLVLPFAAPAASNADLFGMLGIGCRDSACNGSCGSDAACGCDADCSCDPSCECDAVDGRAFAGKTWTCCSECGPPICRCTGPSHCGQQGCGCATTCGCDRRSCPECGCCFGEGCGRLVCLVDRYCGCTGCDGELYWSEWHNDPPRCCDPCDCHGNWVGPGHGGYRAPYHHPYYAGNNVIAPSQVAMPQRKPAGGITRRPETGSDSAYQR